MAFKKVSGVAKYYKYSECEPDQLLVEGTYIGTTPNKFGGVDYQFREDGGQLVTLNKSGHLKFLIEKNLIEGMKARVYYAGTAVLEKGTFKGKDCHQFDLEVEEGEVPSAVAKKKKPIDKAPWEGDDSEDIAL